VILSNFIKSDTLSRQHLVKTNVNHDLGHLLFIENTKNGKNTIKTSNASDCHHNLFDILLVLDIPLGMSKSKTPNFKYMKRLFSRYFVLFELISNHLQLKVDLVIKRQKGFSFTDFWNFTLNTLQQNVVGFQKPLSLTLSSY